MKILLINSFYSRRNPSGENEIFTQLYSLLKKSRGNVQQLSVETDNLRRKRFYQLRCFFNEIFGRGGINLRSKIEMQKPDVIHINNLFPNIGRKSIEKIDVAKILTLHNYRSICVAGSLSRRGTYCDLCLVNPINSLKYRCYRNSFLATFPMFISRLFKHQIKFIESMDLVVVPSQRALEIFQKFGIVNENWRVIPHGIAQAGNICTRVEKKFVFVGRLSPEKGLDKILENWPTDFCIDIYGDGELDIKSYENRENIKFIGKRTRDFVINSLGDYTGLIFASSAPESALPLVALEAIAAGLPIISIEGNTVSDAVTEGGFGIVLKRNFDPIDMNDALNKVEQEFSNLRIKALEYVERYHNQEVWRSNYFSAYVETIRSRKSKEF